jgi:hypothetical protein
MGVVTMQIINTAFFKVEINEERGEIIIKYTKNAQKGAHNYLLTLFVQKKMEEGVRDINADGVDIQGMNKSLSLTFGSYRADCVYYQNNILHVCELKMPQDLGTDRTAKQLERMLKINAKRVLIVPEHARKDAEDILKFLRMQNDFIIETI